MMRMAISPAAAALLRALIARACADRDRILLTDVHSTDWQSLTFTGERHQIALRVIGRDSIEIVERMCAGLSDAEFSIAGLLVADIGVVGSPQRTPDGATELTIEALTITDD
jgi:glycine cleavage system regulatory protein